MTWKNPRQITAVAASLLKPYIVGRLITLFETFLLVYGNSYETSPTNLKAQQWMFANKTNNAGGIN
jgi:hypothetical protein